MCKLLLRHRIKNVALILIEVISLFQKISPGRIAFDSRVMPRRGVIEAELAPASVKPVEFQKAVAVYARIRGGAVFVCPHKSFDDLASKILGKVKDVERHTEPVRHAPSIFGIVSRAASPFPRNADILIFKKLHRDPDAVKSALLHQVCGDRGIDSAAHGNYRFFIHPFIPLAARFPSQMLS